MPVFKSFPFLSVFLFLFVLARGQDCLIDNVAVNDIRHNRVFLTWDFASGENFDIEVEYDTSGFVQGNGAMKSTSGNSVLLEDLEANTDYTFYLTYSCASGQEDIEIGPFQFTTRFTYDGTIAEVLPMESGCTLEPDSVRFLLRNEGGLPLSLVEVNYRVNDRGMDPNYPVDGLYTGLLGTDSADIYAFDLKNAYPEPGDYEYEIWISWDRDQNPSNDTARYLVTNAPIINTLPYSWGFESWSGGWHADALNLDSAFWQRRGSEPEVPAFDSSFVWGGRRDYPGDEQVVSSLLSPCFDFSDIDNDPVVRAALYSDNFVSSDHVLLMEYSLDGGANWNRIPRSEISVNWNTGRNNEVWNRPIEPGKWSFVETVVPGLARQEELQFRWQYFRSAGAIGDGWLLDRIQIRERRDIDLALSPLNAALDLNCTENLIVDLRVRNLGNTNVSSFDLGLQLDGTPLFLENYEVNLPALRDTVLSVDLGRASNFSGQGTIIAEILLAGDQETANNTATQEVLFYPVVEVPVIQDFVIEEDTLGWLLNGGAVFPFNATPGDVIVNDLGPGESWSLITTAYGPLTDGNELIISFNWADEEGDLLDLGDTDSIFVFLSTDCLESNRDLLKSYHAGNYSPLASFPTDTLDLSDYEGENVVVEFLFNNNSADSIQAALDRLIIRGCPEEFDIESEIGAVSNSEDGDIYLVVRNATNPLEFEWDNGTEDNFLDSLSAGDYTVTITDALGCSAVRTYTVDSCDNELDISFNVSRDMDGNFYNGFIEISSIEGVLSDYHIEWSNGLINVPGIYNLPNERFSLRLIDEQGCEYVYQFDLRTTNQTEQEPDFEYDKLDFVLYPNPSSGTVYLRSSIRAQDLLELQVLDPFTGVVLYHKSLENQLLVPEDMKIEGLKNGVNIVSIKTKKQVYSYKVMVHRNQ